MAKRLVIYGVVGIALVGGFYWYTHYYRAQSSPPARVGRRTVSSRPAPPRSPFKRSPVKTEAVKSPKRSKIPAPTAKPAPSPSKVKLPVVAKPAKTPEPTQTATFTEKSSPKRLAKVVEPQMRGENLFTIQVASLVVERNALSLKKRLAKFGYSPVIKKKTARIKRHRVYGGEFTSHQEAEQAARRLNVDGFASNLVRIEHGKVALEVGWSYNLNDAIDIARSLQKKNYTPRIVSKADPTVVHAVRVGRYEDRSEALQVVEALREEGFSPLIIRY